jgi:hypothetical protein
MRVFFGRLALWVCLVLVFTWVGVARLNYAKAGWWESLEKTLADLGRVMVLGWR